MKLAMSIAPILLIAAGCGMRQQTRTTTPPAGPIQTSSSQRDVVPAGTDLTIRVNQEISTSTPGGSFAAEIAQDVVNQAGQMLIPKGSPARLVVTDVSSGGTVGTRTIALALRSVTINGTDRQVTTLTEQQRGREGIGANRRTAETVGGGAAVGAVLGAIIGGGSGAAAGAAIGAAGGAAAQVLTRGSEVRVPAESVLTFRVDQPIQLS